MPPAERKPRQMPGWSLWLAVGSMGLLAATLLVALWTTYRSVNDASNALVRGQSVQLQSSLRSELRELGGLIDEAALKEVFDEHQALGLRYLGVVGTKRQLAQAGSPNYQLSQLRSFTKEMQPGVLDREGDRIRVVFRRILPRRERRNAEGPRVRAVMIEFEPTAAMELRSSSRRSLAIGAGASLILLLIAGALARMLLRREKHARVLEHKRRLENLGQMSAVLAHEIRNPLASLKGNAQILQKLIPKGEASQDKAQKKSDRVVSEAIRLEKLVNDLLAFAKSGDVHPAPCELAPWIDELKAEFDGQRLEVDMTSAPARWTLDAPRMNQVLSNLIRNGLQAGSSVKLSLRERSGELEISVVDDGPGFEGAPSTLFDAFHTSKTHGTGLGLAVAKRLVELHKGRIEARNHSEGGAEFRIRIPKA